MAIINGQPAAGPIYTENLSPPPRAYVRAQARAHTPAYVRALARITARATGVVQTFPLLPSFLHYLTTLIQSGFRASKNEEIVT
jgi:hypothetical protein